jgi:hypothetical protein
MIQPFNQYQGISSGWLSHPSGMAVALFLVYIINNCPANPLPRMSAFAIPETLTRCQHNMVPRFIRKPPETTTTQDSWQFEGTSGILLSGQTSKIKNLT